MFVIMYIKSEISNVIFIINRFVQNSNKIHIKIANDIIDYFVIYDKRDFVYEKNIFDSKNYVDVNYNENLVIKKFIEIYVFILNKKSIN